ncbi:hypothetical protein ACFYVL_42780 [Streptomyces sp. NPDC004111]|uniref:hypothetical protein n=1 Tax=Streptomyces sp. NPDC004111 TaxID=3364690 RepID=UPI00367D2C57
MRATLVQGTRHLPVAFPVSADWTGSPNLHIGPLRHASPRHTASFDPATGQVTALHPGNITLTVTVNNTSRTLPVRVRPATPGRH